MKYVRVILKNPWVYVWNMCALYKRTHVCVFKIYACYTKESISIYMNYVRVIQKTCVYESNVCVLYKRIQEYV